MVDSGDGIFGVETYVREMNRHDGYVTGQNVMQFHPAIFAEKKGLTVPGQTSSHSLKIFTATGKISGRLSVMICV